MMILWFDYSASQRCDGELWSELPVRLHGWIESLFQAVQGGGGSVCTSLAGPLAQMRNWKRLGDGLHRRGTRLEMDELLPYIIGLVIIGLCTWGFAHWRKRNDTTIRCNDPNKLFRELCKLHGVNGSNRRLLKRLADAWDIDRPADIFIAPAAFELVDLPDKLQSSPLQRQQFHALRVKLFGGDAHSSISS